MEQSWIELCTEIKVENSFKGFVNTKVADPTICCHEAL